MRRYYEDFVEFLVKFWEYLAYVRGVVLMLILLMLASGFVFAIWEGEELGDAIYFAFVTGLTVGYGDISPTTGVGKILSVFTGLVGVIFMGVIVAVANRALADTAQFGRHDGGLRPKAE